MSDMIDRAKAKRAMETLHRTRSGYSGMGCNGYLTLTDATAQIIDAIPAVQVVVKPLEWVNRPDRPDYVSDRYVVQVFFGSDQYYFETWDLSVGSKIYDGDDLAAAKAAAQADYDARIRSTLTAQQSPDVAALVEALQDALLWTVESQNRANWREKARAALARVKGGEA